MDNDNGLSQLSHVPIITITQLSLGVHGNCVTTKSVMKSLIYIAKRCTVYQSYMSC